MDKPAVWVDSRPALKRMLGAVRKSRRVAVDTESNSLYAYRERVCLIQVSADGDDFLLDALADLDLGGLGAVFADNEIEKIFHAAEYDIICLKRDYGFRFANLFDTMQAARILGIEKLSLSNMLEEKFEVQQGRSFQKADWGRRPLTDGMKHYARLDTHFLIPLREKLGEALRGKKLAPLAEEDFARLCAVQPNGGGEALYAQVSGYHLLDPRELRVLDELARFRDGQARRMDRPLFKAISSKALLAAAKAKPTSQKDLENVEGLPQRLAQRYGKGLLSAVQAGLKKPPLRIERHRRPSQAYLDRLEALKNWRKKTGRKMGVQSDIVLPRDILEEIAGSNPRDMEALRTEMSQIPWRFQHFGKQILTELKKESAA